MLESTFMCVWSHHQLKNSEKTQLWRLVWSHLGLKLSHLASSFYTALPAQNLRISPINYSNNAAFAVPQRWKESQNSLALTFRPANKSKISWEDSKLCSAGTFFGVWLSELSCCVYWWREEWKWFTPRAKEVEFQGGKRSCFIVSIV